MCDSDMDEDYSDPLEVTDMTNETTLSLLPEKSRKQYEMAYKRYREWCTDKNAVEYTSENVLLAYFSERSTKVQPSSLWAEYSMVRASLSVKEDVNIKIYTKLMTFMKRNCVGFRSKQTKIFNREQIYKFLKEAPEVHYLMKKMAAIFGIAGGCRRDELQRMTIDDIEEVGSLILVKVASSAGNKERSFVVKGEVEEGLNLIDIYHKYVNLRPPHTLHKRFFLTYRSGKCSIQAVGVNTLAKVPYEIAKYLCLENPELYTGRCFRRTSATLLSDIGADILCLKRHYDWKSLSSAERYIEEPFESRTSKIEEPFNIRQIFKQEPDSSMELEYEPEEISSDELITTEMTLQAIKYENNNLEILDQLLLPIESKYIQIKNVEDGWSAINKMQVRGAPAIAIVGCLSLAVELNQNTYTDKSALKQTIMSKLNYLVTSRPTAVNMKLSAEEMIILALNLANDNSVSLSEMKQKFIMAVENMLEKDILDNKAIGENGAVDILQKHTGDSLVRVLTHCNTGSLATAGYGTALGVIRSLHEKERLERVYCTETRPYNQGARLTAYELVHDNIPACLIVDSMVSTLMKTKNISAVVVGADRVARNGDTANKIGTYQIAVVAKYHNVPFYIAAPFTSIDSKIPSGDYIVIEERPQKELTHIGDFQIAAEGIPCWNPAFDVTPASLITGIITEKGVFKPSELENILSSI